MTFLREIPNLKHTNSNNFFLIAGPCVVENKAVLHEIAEKLIEITDKYQIPYFFKASYRKANRSKADSFQGIGDEEGLKILSEIKKTYKVPVVTDIHSAKEASIAAQHVDVLQIPAFLCRQTDILEAAAETGLPINIKKGQFLAPDSMKFVAEKVSNKGNGKIMLTDRGTMFGYQDLLVDFRSIPIMKSLGYPTIMDITHSLQQPNQTTGVSGGIPQQIETIAKAAIATGADGIFMETHPSPEKALSDGANMLALNKVEALLKKLSAIRECVNNF